MCFWLVGLAYFVGCVGFVLLSVCFVWGCLALKVGFSVVLVVYCCCFWVACIWVVAFDWLGLGCMRFCLLLGCCCGFCDFVKCFGVSARRCWCGIWVVLFDY